MDGGFGDDVGVEAVAQVDRVDVVTGRQWVSLESFEDIRQLRVKHKSATGLRTTSSHRANSDASLEVVTYHSRSLYIMVKKTCRNRLTALINTARRKSHASPDIMTKVKGRVEGYLLW